MELGRESTIFVRGRINRGVVVCMENERQPIEKSTSFTKYTVSNGVIDGQVMAI